MSDVFKELEEWKAELAEWDLRFRTVDFGKGWFSNGDHLKWSLEDDTFTINSDGNEVPIFMVDVDNLIAALNLMKTELSEKGLFEFSGEESEPLKIEIKPDAVNA